MGQHGPHHFATLVLLGHNLARTELPRRLRHKGGPALRRLAAPRPVGQHIGAFVPAPDDHDPAGVTARAGRRIDRHHDLLQRRRPMAARARQILGPEQRPLGLDHQPLQLLSLKPRPGVERAQMRQKSRRQMTGIRLRPGPVHHNACLPEQPSQRRDRPRRGGHHEARIIAQSQPQPQIAEHQLRPPPGAEFIGPAMVELRASQTVGVLGREGVGLAAVRPDQTPPPRFPARAFRPLRQGFQPRRPLDHHLAHIVQCRPDEGETPVPYLGKVVDPPGPGKRLAGPAPAKQHPGAPRL